MADLSPNISMMILNVNDLNISIKRQKLTEEIEKHD